MIEIPEKLVRKLNQFQSQHPEIVNVYFLKKIKEGIEKKYDRVLFYKIEGIETVGGVEAENYSDMLEVMMEGFIEIEMYEKAEECKQLIIRLQINKLISESNKVTL